MSAGAASGPIGMHAPPALRTTRAMTFVPCSACGRTTVTLRRHPQIKCVACSNQQQRASKAAVAARKRQRRGGA